MSMHDLSAESQAEPRTLSLGEGIREALIEAVHRDQNVLIMAEGVDDPSSVYGTTKGLTAEAYPKQVIEMPVSENGLMGVAIGAAMMGKRPVISLHRVEFALLAIEQLFNNAAKAHYVSNGAHRVPIVVRMVVGRGWGQGPEHSQSLEAVFAHVPGLKVVMPAMPADAKGLIAAAVEDDNPVVVIEHRWCHYATGDVPAGYHKTDLDGPKRLREGNDVTVVSTSYMTLESVRAADALRKVGVNLDLFDLRVLRPLNLDPIAQSVRRTGRLLAVDTGFRMFGIGGEIVSEMAQSEFSALKAPPRRIGLPPHPTPSSRGLVVGFYPDAQRIVSEVAALLDLPPETVAAVQSELTEQRKDIPVDVPDPYFRGPF